jgi:catechol 2,3-dioxygenase-like lactoylglutathione lyase family enzyme
MEQQGSKVKGLIQTGLVVSSMEEGLHLFRDLLGFKMVADLGTIAGPEFQELSGVPDTVMKIILLQGEAGAQLELFEYVNPQGLARSEMNHYDIGFTHIALEVSGIEDVCQRLKDSGIEFMTPVHILPGVKYAYFRGPDRIMIELQELG